MTGACLQVVAAALIDADQRVLLSKRHADSHQGGLWEFPGGKLEACESETQGLIRELEEELGITVTRFRPLIDITHHYADRSVRLKVFKCDRWNGEPGGLEGQPLNWVTLDRLADYAMPAADAPIVTALRLPGQYLFSPPEVSDPDRFLRDLATALSGGSRLFQFRVFGLDSDDKTALAQAALARCREAGAEMLVNSDLDLWSRLPGAGLHLNRRQLFQAPDLPLTRSGWLAASCHDLGELQRAQQLGVDFAVLSPVLPTRSHPDADLLGWEGFARMTSQTNLPVFALGGMSAATVADAIQAGAQGIAGISGLWPG